MHVIETVHMDAYTHMLASDVMYVIDTAHMDASTPMLACDVMRVIDVHPYQQHPTRVVYLPPLSTTMHVPAD